MSSVNQKLIKDECDNLLVKLTEEYRISPSFAALYMAEYFLLVTASTYSDTDKKVPKDLVKFIETSLPKLMEGNKDLIQRQMLLLNTEGTA